ncbi:hypothetical protein HBA55_01815 [Pseudomaricurvus alkylphenolicus]|nr:hypothetical protein [Pseudomaricurvus alkylphenolicus]
MTTLRILFISCCMLFVGCASNPMQTATNQTLERVSEDKTQVVFMRSSFVGSAINASLYDVTDGDPEFIGIIANDTKIAYETQPGERVFMVVSEAADFLNAQLDGGKVYYSMVTPRMGAWKARFSLWPIRNDGTSKFNTQDKSFDKWIRATKLVENSPKASQWFNSNVDSVKAKQAKYWPVWQQKSEADLAKRTLNPEDGI